MAKLLRSKILRFALVLTTLAAIGCGTPNRYNFNTAQATYNGLGTQFDYNVKLDLLFIIDTTSSMGYGQQNLSLQFATFIDYLQTNLYDFRIGVTTMDMGAGGAQGAFVGSPKIITATTSNLHQTFVNRMAQGTSSANPTQGLDALEKAISTPMLQSANFGWWRNDAMLAIIFLSDKNDMSVNLPQYYIDLLDSKKPFFTGGSRGWVATSIVANDLSQCSGDASAELGSNFMTVSSMSKGIVTSICAPDLVQGTNLIKNRVMEQLTQIHLFDAPEAGTIIVHNTADEVFTDPNNGWTYDPSGFTIFFHGASVPAAGSIVQIDYKPKK